MKWLFVALAFTFPQAYGLPANDIGGDGHDNTTPLNNMQACEADCDHNHHCAAGLECWQRGHGEAMPTQCTGIADAADDYCYDPLLEPVAADHSGGIDAHENTIPVNSMARCTADCDAHAHCADGLKCWQRSNGGAMPTQCVGAGNSGDDYCYDPLLEKHTLVYFGRHFS